MSTTETLVDDDKTRLIRVSGGSQVKETAGCIVKTYDEGREVKLRAIGAGSVNQMYKAMATARMILAQRGLEVLYRPGFEDAEVNGEEKTAMVAYMVVK